MHLFLEEDEEHFSAPHRKSPPPPTRWQNVSCCNCHILIDSTVLIFMRTAVRKSVTQRSLFNLTRKKKPLCSGPSPDSQRPEFDSKGSPRMQLKALTNSAYGPESLHLSQETRVRSQGPSFANSGASMGWIVLLIIILAN